MQRRFDTSSLDEQGKRVDLVAELRANLGNDDFLRLAGARKVFVVEYAPVANPAPR